MKSVSRIGLVGILAVIVAGAVWLRTRKQERNDYSPNDPRARMFAGNALPGFFFASTDPRPNSILHTFTNQTSISRIEVLEQIEPADAKVLMQDGVMGIQALYANALSPYPGDISNKVTTDPAYRPRFVQATNSANQFAYFILYANDRLGYGAATKDAVKFKSLAGWFYCSARKEFFKVKLFVPMTANDRDLEAAFLSLRCAPR